MFSRTVRLFSLLLIASATLVSAQPAGSAPSYRVIVHPRNPLASLDRSYLADAFLKKTTRWDDGESIQPVDLIADSAARRKFTADVLHRSISAVKSYWQQQIFSGRDIPPPELDSDVAVRDYVLKHRGAIGYLSGNADVSGVKVIAVR
jgi:ABC-type phosphate transport system substrate-binding protein